MTLRQSHKRRIKILLLIVVVLTAALATAANPQKKSPPRVRPFRVEEKSIAQIHTALRARQVTCRGLVEAYLARIDAFDQKGPSINAVLLLNPEALKTADELDARMKTGVAMRPLE